MEGRSTLSVGLLGGVLLFEWRGQHFFPAGNSLVQKVESHMDQISCQEQMAFLFKLISHFWSSLRPYFLFRTMNILQLCANSHRIPTLLLPLSIWHPQKCFANHLFHTKVSSPLLFLYKLAFHRGRGFRSPAPWSTSSSGAGGLCCLPPPETYARKSITSPADQAADEKKSYLSKNRQYPRWTHTHTRLLSY